MAETRGWNEHGFKSNDNENGEDNARSKEPFTHFYMDVYAKISTVDSPLVTHFFLLLKIVSVRDNL